MTHTTRTTPDIHTIRDLSFCLVCFVWFLLTANFTPHAQPRTFTPHRQPQTTRRSTPVTTNPHAGQRRSRSQKQRRRKADDRKHRQGTQPSARRHAGQRAPNDATLGWPRFIHITHAQPRTFTPHSGPQNHTPVNAGGVGATNSQALAAWR